MINGLKLRFMIEWIYKAGREKVLSPNVIPLTPPSHAGKIGCPYDSINMLSYGLEDGGLGLTSSPLRLNFRFSPIMSILRNVSVDVTIGVNFWRLH